MGMPRYSLRSENPGMSQPSRGLGSAPRTLDEALRLPGRLRARENGVYWRREGRDRGQKGAAHCGPVPGVDPRGGSTAQGRTPALRMIERARTGYVVATKLKCLCLRKVEMSLRPGETEPGAAAARLIAFRPPRPRVWLDHPGWQLGLARAARQRKLILFEPGRAAQVGSVQLGQKQVRACQVDPSQVQFLQVGSRESSVGEARP